MPKSRRLLLTDTQLRRLKPPDDGDLYVRDAELVGFGVRVKPTGTVSFIVEARQRTPEGSRSKRKVLGRWPEMPAEQARAEASITLGSWQKGEDSPKEIEAAAVEEAVPTLSEVLDDYISTRTLKDRTVEDYRTVLDTAFSLDFRTDNDKSMALAPWKDLPMTSIKRSMVQDRHKVLGSKSKSRANNAMRILRALFNYAIEVYEDRDEEPLVKHNPVIRLNRVEAWYKVPRRRTTIRSQLKDWYDGVEALEGERKGSSADIASDYLKFQLFTGVRMREGLGLEHDDVDLTNRIFICDETKNWEEHALPISEPIFEILDRRLAELGPWVFQGVHGPLQDVRWWMAKVTENTGVQFTLNDLRRTFISIAEGLDLSGYTLKRLLNHKITEHDVTAGYIVTDVERLRDPMERIATHILKLVE